MAKSHVVLGLDLGPNSIGWALLDEGQGKLIATGVRVFPEGVDRDQKGGELSKNESRRVARGMRRQIFRRSRRKKLLRAALVAAGLLPADSAEQRRLDELDPYALRRRGLTERLEPYEFGRVLVHLNQRRGFLSNRKTDKAQAKENSDLLKELGVLAEEIAAAGHRTLGEHLAVKYAADPRRRLRKLHTRRDMLEGEFEQLWEAQRRHHPELLTDRLQYGVRGKAVYPTKPVHIGKRSRSAEFGLHGIIFYQRPMYWPASVVGRCELEPKCRRCPRGDRLAQRFRVLQEVNHLQVIEPDGEIRPLTPEERRKLLTYLAESKERKFDEIRKKLKLREGTGFNLQIGERKGLKGMPTDALLAGKKLFGPAWYDRPEDEKNRIVRSLLDDDERTILTKARDEWGCDDELAERLANLDLGDGYSSYSREAIVKLLPFLEQGQLLMTRDGTPCALVGAGYLRPDQRPITIRDELPAPPDIANPLVRQALYEVRKVVNALLREYGKPDAIHIELARDVKGNAEQRAEQTHVMREREARRAAAAAWLEEHGEKPTREKIEKYLLWIEQEEKCIYSGRTISKTQLFGDAEIDHILPYPRSLDNSLMNKVLAFRKENADKGDRTPYEWLAETNPEKYEAVLQRVAKLPVAVRFPKLAKFKQRALELNDFVNRQLADTRYITAAVCEYLKCLDVDVLGSKGQLTADLRWRWGLDTVLRHDGLKLKNRDDHRHHAVDAIVIALTDRSRLQKLARTRGLDAAAMPDPWPDFRRDVEKAVGAINVSHRVRRKVAGALHEETLYGPTKTPGEYVYRKSLETLTPAMIEDIVDPEVRRLVVERLQQHGITPGEKGKIPPAVWKEPLYLTRKPGRTSANPAEIKKVRIVKRDQTIRPIRGGEHFVKPGSTHHIMLFETTGDNGKPTRLMYSVSMLEAARRVRDREPLYQRSHPDHPQARFLMSLSQNEMVLLTHAGQEHLCRYDTSAATSGQMWFRRHTAGGKSSEKLGVISKMPNTFEGRKVTVDVLGRIRDAND